MNKLNLNINSLDVFQMSVKEMHNYALSSDIRKQENISQFIMQQNCSIWVDNQIDDTIKIFKINVSLSSNLIFPLIINTSARV